MIKNLCVLLVNCKFKNKGDDLMDVQLLIMMLDVDIISQSSQLNQLLLSSIYFLK